MPDLTRSPGFNVIGHVSGNLGLGVLARNTIKTLSTRRFPVAALDIDPGLDRGNQDLSYASLTVEHMDQLPYGINLFVLPALSLQSIVPTLSELVVDAARINVALPMWELYVLPPLWRDVLEFFDVLVAGSAFIRSTFELNLSGVFSVHGNLPVFLPANVRSDRARFDLPEDRVIFLSAFEPFSDPGRKNPEGALEAFSRITAKNDRVLLALKVNNSEAALRDPKVARFLDRAKRLPGVKILTESYSYQDVAKLYASVDVVVSLHRSEGIGLVPQEAMSLGKPVIATGWSGNMDYMNHTNACLVDHELVPVKGSGGIYEKMLAGLPAKWAEPNLATAAAWMEKLAADSGLRSSYGRAAQSSMEAYQTEALQARFLDELVQIHKNRDFLCKTPAERERRLRSLGIKNRIDATKRRVRAGIGRGIRAVLRRD